MIAGRSSATVRRSLWAVWIVWGWSLLGGLPAESMASDQETTGQPGYVRTVDGSPSLAEMEKGKGWSYNGEYLYSLTRGVRDSSLPAGAKVVVFLPAFVVDTAFLPVALIFGLFGS